MSSMWRRFEVLLPLRFNDGRDIPTEWLAEAVLEVVTHFGAASYEPQKLEGHWRQEACCTTTIWCGWSWTCWTRPRVVNWDADVRR